MAIKKTPSDLIGFKTLYLIFVDLWHSSQWRVEEEKNKERMTENNEHMSQERGRENVICGCNLAKKSQIRRGQRFAAIERPD